MLIEYITRTAYATYRHRIECDTVTDEPYPPGGFLRVMRRAGQVVAGPHVSEIQSWRVLRD